MQKKSVHWLARGESDSPDWLSKHPIASIRLRAGAAHDFLNQHGYVSTAGESVSGFPQILVVGKIGAEGIEKKQYQWTQKILESKSRGCLVVLDYTDHHLGIDSPMAPFYKDILETADAVVCPSDSMRKLIEPYWSGLIEVIEDTIEVQPLPPKTELNRPTTILWFGHASNMNYLAGFVRNWDSKTGNFRLLALTNEVGARKLLAQGLLVPSSLQLKVLPWSVRSMIDASRESDLCIIPSNPSDPKKKGASANRLITALALGIPVAANNLDSYVEFQDYYVDINSELFKDFLVDPLAFSDQVLCAQNEIVPKFERVSIAKKWMSLFEGLNQTR